MNDQIKRSIGENNPPKPTPDEPQPEEKSTPGGPTSPWGKQVIR